MDVTSTYGNMYYYFYILFKFFESITQFQINSKRYIFNDLIVILRV